MELCVVISDQQLGRHSKWRRFPQLLGDPGIGQVAGHGDMDDISAPQLDDKEGKERTEEEICDEHEVARPDLMRVVVQEGAPALRSRTCRLVAHVLLHGTFRNVHPQSEQLSPNRIRSAPHQRLFSAIVWIKAMVSAGILGFLEAALDCCWMDGFVHWSRRWCIRREQR
jgi:hypothetical protein